VSLEDVDLANEVTDTISEHQLKTNSTNSCLNLVTREQHMTDGKKYSIQ